MSQQSIPEDPGAITPDGTINPLVPRIIHLMFFPWGKDQKLIADQNDFDHTPYENMVRYASEFEVKLWDYYAAEKICLEHYPEVWTMAINFPRPMMTVNTLRWLMVYHHGGLSWQYDMNPLRPMEQYLPSKDKECRLFTEFVLFPDECRIKSDQEPIRAGVPEEPVRIPSQVFSAIPQHRYMKSVVGYIQKQAATYTFKRDYDCQFITGNAAASTAYDLFGKNDPTVERVGAVETRRMIKIIYLGTWRTEASNQGSEVRSQESGSALASSIKRVIKNVPGYYRVKPHVHESAFREAREEDAELTLAENTLVDAVADLVAARQVRSVLNYPAPHLPGLRERLPDTVRYTEGDMVRGGTAGWMNLMFSKIPSVDLLIARGLFDHLPDYDVLRILDRCRKAGVKYILADHYPCLNGNWENYPGEWQPVKLTLKPFNLTEPEAWIADPDPDRRTDRGLGLFRL